MKEEISRVILRIRQKPYLIRMGANRVADIVGVSPEDVREAKKILYKENFNYNFSEKGVRVYSAPRILLLDIETAPLLAYIFQKQIWKARITHEKVLSDWFILTFSCKYLGEDEIISNRLTSEEAINQDDSRLIEKLWYLLCDSDIVVCHGGDYFDIPNINTRFVVFGMGPTTHYRQIDTLKVAQRQFGFTHNSLAALADFFGIVSKIETTFDLWKRCFIGDEKALFEMESYNRRDVEILEEVYLKLRPWIKSHPNLSIYDNSVELTCPHCRGHNLKPDGGYYTTQTGRYPTYRCFDCGATPRDRKSDLSKDKKKSLLVSIPGR